MVDVLPVPAGHNRGVELTELAITPAQLAAVIGLVADGS